MTIQPIFNWRSAWRMFSVQVAAVAVAWGLLPADAQAAMLAAVGLPAERIPAVLGVLFLVARMVSQPALHAPPPELAQQEPPA